jgi:quinone-modifying oxidoreductase subunit QmoB
MDKKYGVYICEGCGLGDSLDIEKLCEVSKEEGLAAKTCPVLSSPEGVALLKKDISDEGVNTLVIAACSRRVLYDVFRFDGCIVDRVNLREQVVWSHPREKFPAPTEEQKDDENFVDHVQLLAEDYLKMGMARVKKIDMPEAYQLDNFSRKILVIGGGITGRQRRAVRASKVVIPPTWIEFPRHRTSMPLASPWQGRPKRGPSASNMLRGPSPSPGTPMQKMPPPRVRT